MDETVHFNGIFTANESAINWLTKVELYTINRNWASFGIPIFFFWNSANKWWIKLLHKPVFGCWFTPFVSKLIIFYSQNTISRNRWLCMWSSINIQTTVGARNTWQHNYHTYLNNFILASLIITLLILKKNTHLYNNSLLRTPVTILHSRMQNDKCEYLKIYITIKHF